jgi:hypothetical protein
MEQIAIIAEELGHSVVNIAQDQFGFSVSLRTRAGQIAVVRVRAGLSDPEIRERLDLS